MRRWHQQVIDILRALRTTNPAWVQAHPEYYATCCVCHHEFERWKPYTQKRCRRCIRKQWWKIPHRSIQKFRPIWPSRRQALHDLQVITMGLCCEMERQQRIEAIIGEDWKAS